MFLKICKFWKNLNHDLWDTLLHTKLNSKIDVIPRNPLLVAKITAKILSRPWIIYVKFKHFQALAWTLSPGRRSLLRLETGLIIMRQGLTAHFMSNNNCSSNVFYTFIMITIATLNSDQYTHDTATLYIPVWIWPSLRWGILAKSRNSQGGKIEYSTAVNIGQPSKLFPLQQGLLLCKVKR